MINESEFEWAQQPIIGLVLMTAQTDSNGDIIRSDLYYKVAKHKPTGTLLILPVIDKKNLFDEYLSNSGQLN